MSSRVDSKHDHGLGLGLVALGVAVIAGWRPGAAPPPSQPPPSQPPPSQPPPTEPPPTQPPIYTGYWQVGDRLRNDAFAGWEWLIQVARGVSDGTWLYSGFVGSYGVLYGQGTPFTDVSSSQLSPQAGFYKKV